MTRRVLRDHERRRLLQEQEASDAAARKKFWHNVFVIKCTIMSTFILYMVVPPEYKDWVALGGNFLWLWKT